MRTVLLVLLALAPPLAQAGLIRIVASGAGPIIASDPQGVLPFPSAGAIGPYTLALTLDTSVADSRPDDPVTGVYLQSLTDVTLGDGATLFNGWPDTAVMVTNDLSAPNAVPPASDWWSASTWSTSPPDANGATRTWKFELVFRSWTDASPPPPLDSDSLVPPPPLASWAGGALSYIVFDRTATGSASTVAWAQVNIDTLTVTAVPAPPAAALLAPALLAVLARARRRTARA